MAVRSTMANLISETRILTGDLLPSGSGQIFSDQTVQDVLDSTRTDIYNAALDPKPTYVTGTISFLDYFTPESIGYWEDDLVLKQFLTIVVTPSLSENLVGHWQFSSTTLPPIYLTGKTYDLYRAAADLLERQAAQWTLNYDFASDGQSFKRSQAALALQKLAMTYRLKQRVSTWAFRRGDVDSFKPATGLGPMEIDYMANGKGS